MKIAIMQPYLFPYLGYFQLIAAVDKFVILDDVNYINKGWINRNRILINGKSSMFTIPLVKASQNRLIKDIQISPDTRWVSKFLKSVEMAYKKAPYYDETIHLIKKIVEKKVSGISDLVHISLWEICEYLDIRTEIEPHSEKYNTEGLQGQHKILQICSEVGATLYINPMNGVDLYEKSIFEEKGVDLKFILPVLSHYPQPSRDFIEGLSIIDVMMYNSPAEIKDHLKNYKLI